ncbi:DUF2635 domain-containing protein [Trabulsiella odontotermitis]|uniref:DUF2635 domain-containing protein n=1 Tax=Trabulsiella odontotermitis TaxID=379893 RepID=UPI000676B013|nr:DUF2635 domain-containing protein [Trabulsiella odontotermitis]KNC89901.1 hypothetical protein GM30_06025 [Trabulsiella odontotermitis]
MSKMKVKAVPGVKVPREDNPRRYITGDVVEVEDTAYYRRQIMAGDLIDVSAATVKAGAKNTDTRTADKIQEVNSVQS